MGAWQVVQEILYRRANAGIASEFTGINKVKKNEKIKSDKIIFENFITFS